MHRTGFWVAVISGVASAASGPPATPGAAEDAVVGCVALDTADRAPVVKEEASMLVVLGRIFETLSSNLPIRSLKMYINILNVEYEI